MQTRNSTTILKVLLLAILVSGCTSMPISSMYKLRNLEPQDIRPAEVGIAVITHKGIRLSDGSANLVIGYKSIDPEHTFSSKISASVAKNPSIEILQDNRRNFEDITLFYLKDDAAETLRIAQNRIQAIKQLDIEGGGSLSVSVNHACAEGERPKELTANIYVKFNNQIGYLLLASNVDLNEAAKGADQADFWRECSMTPTIKPQPTQQH